MLPELLDGDIRWEFLGKLGGGVSADGEPLGTLHFAQVHLSTTHCSEHTFHHFEHKRVANIDLNRPK